MRKCRARLRSPADRSPPETENAKAQKAEPMDSHRAPLLSFSFSLSPFCLFAFSVVADPAPTCGVHTEPSGPALPPAHRVRVLTPRFLRRRPGAWIEPSGPVLVRAYRPRVLPAGSRPL